MDGDHEMQVRPRRAALAIVSVFLPLVLACLLMAWTESMAVVFAGMIVSLGVATYVLRRWSVGWAGVGLGRGLPPWWLLLTVVPAAFALLIVAGVAQALFTAATGLTPDLSRFASLRDNPPLLFGWLAMVWTIAAFGEEMLFRGFLLNVLCSLLRPHLRRRWAWLVALLLSSVAVGIGHAYQGIAGIVLAGLIGFGFGVVYLASRRNLWAPILTHGLFDTVAFVMLYLSLSSAGNSA